MDKDRITLLNEITKLKTVVSTISQMSTLDFTLQYGNELLYHLNKMKECLNKEEK